MAFLSTSEISKIPTKNDIQKMYDWYQEVKTATYIWAFILEFVFLSFISCSIFGVLFGIPWFFYKHFWGVVTVDTKFTAIITIAIFVLGVVIGRHSNQKSKPKKPELR